MTADLDQLSREDLIERARELGAERPEVMTRVELRDEIVRLSEPDPALRRRSRGWLGVARDLVASVVDAGLNMPGAAAAIRGDARPAEETTGPPPVATLTLAEIYLAQGHIERALAVLEEVLVTEPEHAPALALRDRIQRERASGAFRRRAALEPEDVGDEALSSPPAPAPFTSSSPPNALREPPRMPEVVEPPVPETVATPAPEAGAPPLDAGAGEPFSAPPAHDAGAAPPFVSAVAPESVREFAPAPEIEPPAGELPPDAAAFARTDAEPEDAPLVPAAERAFDLTTEDERAPAPHFLPEFQTEPGAPPARPSALGLDSTPPSAPTPTLAAPSPRNLAASPSTGAVCVLVQRGSEVVAHYRVQAGAERLLLRVVWFVPGRRGPTEGSFDAALEPGSDRVILPPVDPSAHVRGALGGELEGAFKPHAVAWVYRVSDVGVSVAFAAPGAPPVALRAQLGPELADLLV